MTIKKVIKTLITDALKCPGTVLVATIPPPKNWDDPDPHQNGIPGSYRPDIHTRTSNH